MIFYIENPISSQILRLLLDVKCLYRHSFAPAAIIYWIYDFRNTSETHTINFMTVNMK